MSVSLSSLGGDFLRGSYVPLVVPFNNGHVDLQEYAALVERQVSGGSAGLVVNGTSGEPSVLTMAERTALVQVAVKAAAGRVPVVAATGSQSLAETLELTRQASDAGADALLVVTPYYLKPPQRGMIEYFVRVARSTDLPILIYHIPGRAAVSISVGSVLSIVEQAPNVVGLKHAVNDLEYATELLHRLGSEFRLFGGIEQLSFPLLTIGGSGLMNAVGNLIPGPVSQLCQTVSEDRLREARQLHDQLFELNQAIFWDTNPIPLKYLMWRCRLLQHDEHRLPMSPPERELRDRLDDLLSRTPTLAAMVGSHA